MNVPRKALGFTAALLLSSGAITAGSQLMIYVHHHEESYWLAGGSGVAAIAFGFLVFMYRTCKLVEFELNDLDLRVMYGVTCWLYVPAICMALLAVVLLFIVSFAAAFYPAILEGDSRPNAIFSGMLIGWLITAALSWFDFMLLSNEVRRRKRGRVPVRM